MAPRLPSLLSVRSKKFKYIESRSTSDRSKSPAQPGAGPMDIGSFAKGGKTVKGGKGMKGQFCKFGKGPRKGSPIKGGKGKKGKGKSKEGKPSQPSQNTPKGKGKSKGVQCYSCYEYGHIAQNCPTRMIYGFEHDPAWEESWDETGYEVDEFRTELGNS